MKHTVLFTLSLIVVLLGFFSFLSSPRAQRLWNSSARNQELSSKELDHLRNSVLKQRTTMTVAPHRPALGLNLNHTSMREASNWLLDKGLRCEHSVHGYAYLKCRQINTTSLGDTHESPIDELDLSFNAHGKLIAVSLLRRNLSSEQTSDLLQRLSTELNQYLGHPTKVTGNIEAKSFEKPMNSVSIEYSYKDYLAKFTASNLPWSGVVLYEQYMSY